MVDKEFQFGSASRISPFNEKEGGGSLEPPPFCRIK
jgi:hypothetical protein